MKTVVIDPGHGGTDPGAIAPDGTTEAELVLDYSLGVGDLLRTRAPEMNVVFTHRGSGASLSDRVRMANELDADLFVSFHANAAENPDANGFEIFTTRGDTGADRVASVFYRQVQTELPDIFRPRVDWTDGDPDREANFYVLRKTRPRAVLVEFGFITNERDLALLKHPGIRERWITAGTHAIILSI